MKWSSRERVVFASTILWVLSACSPYQVVIKKESDASLSTYKTYGWMAPTVQPALGQPPVKPEIVQDIVDAIDQTMTSKGYQKAQNGPPDFVIGALAASEEKVDATYLKDYERAEFMGFTYKLGTLIIGIADASGKPQWRGTAQTIINSANTPEKTKTRITEAVQAILNKFPSKSS